jgi:hypothetical protein
MKYKMKICIFPSILTGIYLVGLDCYLYFRVLNEIYPSNDKISYILVISRILCVTYNCIASGNFIKYGKDLPHLARFAIPGLFVSSYLYNTQTYILMLDGQRRLLTLNFTGVNLTSRMARIERDELSNGIVYTLSTFFLVCYLLSIPDVSYIKKEESEP